MARLRPYPAYKDSGVPGLGRVPEHWDMRRLKAVVASINEQARSAGDREPYIALEHVESWTGRAHPPRVPIQFDSQVKRFHSDDVLFGKLRPYLAKVTRPRSSGVCVGEFLVLRARISEVAPSFLEQLLRSNCVISEVNGWTFGAKMPRADWDIVGNLRVAFPLAHEQSVIARFLDHAERRIRRYIAAKKRLIVLLNEQKQAIISRAVARGLDPNVPLKPSGEPRLGDVPKHWLVSRLGRLITLQRGFDITKENQVDGVIPVVSSGGISSYHNRPTSRGPGVIVGRKGSAGSVYYVESDYWAHDTTLWVREFNGNHPKFVFYLLVSLDLKRFDTGSANPTINRNIVHPEIVAFPPVAEQESIAQAIDHNLALIDRYLDHIDRGISMVREYRTRLIADVVTGKLDVRDAAARLPEEPEEDEPIFDGDTLLDETEQGDALEGAMEEAAP